MRETQVQSMGWEDPLEKEMATQSSIFALKIPRRSLAGNSPWGHKGIVHDLVTKQEQQHTANL